MPSFPRHAPLLVALCRRLESVHGASGVRFFARRGTSRGHAPVATPGGHYVVASSRPPGLAALDRETPGSVEVAFVVGLEAEDQVAGPAAIANAQVVAALVRAASARRPALVLAPFVAPRAEVPPEFPWIVWRGATEIRVLLRPGEGVEVSVAGASCAATEAALADFVDAARDAQDTPPVAEADGFAERVAAALSEARLDSASLHAGAAALVGAQRAGDCYLANLAETLVLAPPRAIAPPLASSTLARYLASPARLGAHAISRGGSGALLLSPERFVRTTSDGLLVTEPVKGTAPCSPEPTAAELAVLWESRKETCEQILVTDLLRNDLALVCEPGSVAVSDPFTQRVSGRLLQMQSTVHGLLRPALREGAAFLPALLPAGSISGTPKKRACELLSSLEARARGYYTGVVGHLFSNGSFDSAVAIRSVFLDARGLTVGVGAGLTVLSDPRAEIGEMELKLDSIRAAWSNPPSVPGRGSL